MSYYEDNVVRYNVAGLFVQQLYGEYLMYAHEDGEYVCYEDYARLKAEVERMSENERLKRIPIEAKLCDRVYELNKQVERLTKAGDAMAEWIKTFNQPHISAFEWQAAKEGGQP